MSLDLEALDRNLLYVMVAGPGFGEGVAVALPERGWILVDGCRVDGPVGEDLPLAAIVERFRRPDLLDAADPSPRGPRGWLRELGSPGGVRAGTECPWRMTPTCCAC